jgi:hypothetical protein
MYKPYRVPVDRAYPDIKTPEPRISKFVVFLIRLLGRIYLFFWCGIAKIVLQDDIILFEAFKRALSGKSRCILAFRHPNGGEPQLMTWFFLFRLRYLAGKKKVKFPRWPHAVFVYGYEVVRWGGWVARFIMPGVGAMPIHHAKMDSQGMARIYKAIIDGPYPVALAPEGQVSYTTDSVPRLEPGTIRIGFHAAERLAAKKTECPVEILPVSIYFHFGSWGVLTLEPLLKKIEKACGLYNRGRKKIPYSQRVKQCRNYILELNETRYKIQKDDLLSFEQRLEKVINSALETAERMMGFKSEGDFFTRKNQISQLCWDRIYLPGEDCLDNKTQVQRSTLDLQAGEAWYISRHIELAEFGWYFRGAFPSDDAALHNKIEYAQNLWDFTSRTMGGAFKDRAIIFPRKVIVHASPAINLSERLEAYREDRKTAIKDALADLEKAYNSCPKNIY